MIFLDEGLIFGLISEDYVIIGGVEKQIAWTLGAS